MADRTTTPAAATAPPTRRTRRWAAGLGVGCLIALSACTGSSAQPEDDPSGASATAHSVSPTPSPSPSSTPSPSPTQTPAPKGEELWKAGFEQEDDFEKFEVQRSGDTFLVRNDRTVWAMSKQGKELWRYEPPEPDDPDTDRVTLDVVDDLAVVTFDTPDNDDWPQRLQFRVLDVESGEIVWQDDDVAFHTVVADTVYTTRCNGKQDGGFDNCTVAKQDVRTGASDWVAPTQASARVKPAEGSRQGDDPQFLLLTVFPNGSGDQTQRTLDPGSAQYFGVELQTRNAIRTATDTVVDAGPWDGDSSDGCSSEVTGHDLFTGEERWKHTWNTQPEGDGCVGVLQKAQHGDLLAAADARGRPFLLDLRTGTSQWKGDAEAWVPWLDAKRVLVSESDGGPVRMIDHRRDKELWTIPHHDLEQGYLEVHGDRLVNHAGSGDASSGGDGGVRGYDLDSGTVRYRAPGAYVGGGDGWVATVTESDTSTEATVRVFTEP